MSLKEKFLAFIDVFQDLGKEVFAFLVLGSGLILLCKGELTGQQFTDMVKAIGCAYVAGATIGSASDSIVKHLENKVASLKEKL